MLASSSQPIHSDHNNELIPAWLDLSYKGNPGDEQEIDTGAIIQQIQPETASLNLSGHRMGDDQAIRLAAKLRNNNTLVSLDLSDNGISQDGVNKIYEILFSKSKKKLQTITTSLRPSIDEISEDSQKLLNKSLSYIIIDEKKYNSKNDRNSNKYKENLEKTLTTLIYFIFYVKNDNPFNYNDPILSLKLKRKFFNSINHVNPLIFLNKKFFLQLKHKGYSLEKIKIGAETIKININTISLGIRIYKGIGWEERRIDFQDQLADIFDKPLLHLAVQFGSFNSRLEFIRDNRFSIFNLGILQLLDKKNHTPLYYTLKYGHLENFDILFKKLENPFQALGWDSSTPFQETDLANLLMTERAELIPHFLISVVSHQDIHSRTTIHRQLLILALEKRKIDTVSDILNLLPQIYSLLRYSKSEFASELDWILNLWNTISNQTEESNLLPLIKTAAQSLLTRARESSDEDFSHIMNHRRRHVLSRINQDPIGMVPLHTAARANNLQAVLLLLQYHPDVNKQTTAEMISETSYGGETLERSSDNEAGFTALHYAVQNRNPELIILLLENDADPTVRDGFRSPLGTVSFPSFPKGRTPLDLAHTLRAEIWLEDNEEEIEQWDEIIKLLESYTQRFNEMKKLNHAIYNQLLVNGFTSSEGKDYIDTLCSDETTISSSLGNKIKTTMTEYEELTAKIDELHERISNIEKLSLSQAERAEQLDLCLKDVRDSFQKREILIQQMSALLHIDLKNEINYFLHEHKFKNYFRVFHQQFSNCMNILLEGMFTSRSSHVSASTSTSVDVTNQVGAFLKPALNLFGAGGIVSVATWVIGYYPNKLHNNRLEGISSLFDSSMSIGLFTQQLSCHLMGILQNLIPLIDKYANNENGYIVHERAIERLVGGLSIRLIDYMFVKHLRPNEEWSSQNEKAIDNYSRDVALSIIWYDINVGRVRESLGKKLLPSDDRMIKLPYKDDLGHIHQLKMKLSNAKKNASQRASSVREKLRRAPKGSKPKKLKRTQQSIAPEEVILTVGGCLQESLLECQMSSGDVIFYANSHKDRSNKYPSLVLSPDAITHIDQTAIQEYQEQPFTLTTNSRLERRTISYREYFLEQQHDAHETTSSSSPFSQNSFVLPHSSLSSIIPVNSSSAASSSSSSAASSSPTPESSSATCSSSNILPPLTSNAPIEHSTSSPSSSSSSSIQLAGEFTKITAALIPESAHIEAIRSEFQHRIDSLTGELDSMRKRVFNLEERLHKAQNVPSQKIAFSPEEIHRIVEEKFSEMRRKELLANAQIS